jgi:hypothetical protein
MVHFHHSLKVCLVDDSAEIGALLDVIAIPLLQHNFRLLQELLLRLLAAQNVVGCDARLTGIDEFAPQHSSCRLRDVNRVICVFWIRVGAMIRPGD